MARKSRALVHRPPARRPPRGGRPAPHPETHDRASEVRALQARVEALTGELHAVHEEIEALSYSVSHDLRAPVRHIDGFLRLLADELVDPGAKATHYIDTAAGAARRLGTLIDDLLAYSRTARLPLEPARVALGELVRELVSRYEMDVGGPRVAWVVDELPAVQADRAQLRIVLQHLLSNARKFSRGQSLPRVEVRARAVGGGRTEVSVRDNGVGFDPRHADRLFGVFQKLHGEGEFEGNGVGLAIARRILHRHGERIRGEAVPGEGAAFTFTLRLADGS